MKAIVISLAAVLLSSCAGPRPLAPIEANVSAPARWQHPNEGPQPPAIEDWAAEFGDPVLTRLVREALANNVDIALAATRVAQARAQLDLAQAQRQVDVVGGLAGARERDLNPGFGIPEEQTESELGFSASYEIDLFGRLSAASESARANLLASRASRETVRLAVVASVIGGYINLRGLDARQAVLAETLSTRASELSFAKRRADVGYAPVIDLRQAEAAFRSTEQLIPATALAIERQENALCLLIGGNPGPVDRGSELASLDIPPAPSLLPSQLLRQRPDLRQAEDQVVAADRSLDAARAAFMPRISLSASGGFVDSTLIEDPVRVFSIGGSILAPILDGGRLRAQQNVAAGKRDEAAFAYRKATLNAFKEVEDALESSKTSEQQERSIQLQRDALEAVYVLAKKRYRAGYSPYLEQLDAQRALLNAELSSVQVRVDRLGAAVVLYQSLGGGWDGTNELAVD